MQHRCKSLIPLTFLLLSPPSSLAENGSPIAVRKLSPDASEKLFPEHLALSPLHIFPLRDASAAATSFLDSQDNEIDQLSNATRPYRPSFALHRDGGEHIWQRAAEALDLLQIRQACPSGMTSCSDIGTDYKCCPGGTYCVEVTDTSVACCPEGATCGGEIGECPAGAVSCSPELGGGCCIPGYVCQGVGCVPSSVATSIETAVETTVEDGVASTITTTRTTTIEGVPSTVIVTLTVTETPSLEPTTLTSTEVVTASDDATATGGAPWRPTLSSITTEPPETQDDSSTQTGCPTGFYGCLATHGGGCCRTGRDCDTSACPPPSTTIISDGATIVVLASDVPTTTASSTCADGWFLCGASAGPVPGCCPSGFDCGTASCFTVQASRTAQVQKQFAKPNSGKANTPCLWSGALIGLMYFPIFMNGM